MLCCGLCFWALKYWELLMLSDGDSYTVRGGGFPGGASGK